MEKAPGVFAVCADPAYNSGKMNKDIGARFPKETGNVALYTQIIVRTARQEELVATALAKFLRDKRTEESVSTGHNDTLAVPEGHIHSLRGPAGRRADDFADRVMPLVPVT
jgi:hypothetical protein